MISVRRSRAEGKNEKIRKVPPPRDGRIRALLDEFLDGQDANGIVMLVGGSDLLHFRLRVAQSLLRPELTPSTWSHAGLLMRKGKSVSVCEIPLDPPNGFQDMPRCNGIHTLPLARYENTELFPNVALLRFPVDTEQLLEAIGRVRSERGVLDLVSAIPPWLGYVWGTNLPTNPLTSGMGLPSAVFIEAVFAALGVDLTPGLATRSSCPEAIWQAARYWHEFFSEQARLEVEGGGTAASAAPPAGSEPSGIHWVGQPYAAIIGEDE